MKRRCCDAVCVLNFVAVVSRGMLTSWHPCREVYPHRYLAGCCWCLAIIEMRCVWCRCRGVGVGAVTNRLSGNRCNHDHLRNPQARGFDGRLSSDADVWLSESRWWRARWDRRGGGIELTMRLLGRWRVQTMIFIGIAVMLTVAGCVGAGQSRWWPSLRPTVYRRWRLRQQVVRKSMQPRSSSESSSKGVQWKAVERRWCVVVGVGCCRWDGRCWWSGRRESSGQRGRIDPDGEEGPNGEDDQILMARKVQMVRTARSWRRGSAG